MEYKRGKVVSGRVERVFPFGIFVRLEDGNQVYVRRRELTVSGDVDLREVVKEGQEIEGVIIELDISRSLMEISVRDTLADPWDEFSRRFEVGEVVSATVKNVRHDRVYVKIMDGVDGVIHVKEMASWEVGKTEDVLWPGDTVEAVITHMDVARKRVQLSIRRRMKQLAKAEAIAEQIYKKGQVKSAVESRLQDEENEVGDEGTVEIETEAGEIGMIGTVLVVEDHDTVRGPLVKWLSEQGCTAEGTRLASEALKRCKEQNLGAALVDLNLPGMDGVHFIRQLREDGINMPVAVMSGPELIAEQLPALQTLGVATAFAKPLDQGEIHRFLVQLSQGEIPTLSAMISREKVSAEAQPFQKLAEAMRSGQPPVQRFLQGLEQLVRDTRAEMGIVFQLDRVSRTVTIVARSGNIPLNEEALYGLMESPVKDVVLEEEPVWENQASSERFGQFRKLLDLLSFESCIGVPIQASGKTEHALFLFHRDKAVFSRYRLRDALAVASFFAVVLESQALNERVQSLSRIFLSGHLAAGFGHEVYNRVSGLDLQFSNICSDFESLGRAVPGLSERRDFQEIQQDLGKAVETAESLKRTVEDFQRLMRTEETQGVNVNQVVRLAEVQVRPLARRAKVGVRLRLAQDLPLATGNSIRLQQVFLNLMLNAVQHMANKPDSHRVLTVSTACEVEGDSPWVRVRFSDTGPGIHRRLWDNIFALGFTTRVGGSGLGLYIARSLVESIGGRIQVEESLVPLGTTFLVELPAVKEVERDKVKGQL